MSERFQWRSPDDPAEGPDSIAGELASRIDAVPAAPNDAMDWAAAASAFEREAEALGARGLNAIRVETVDAAGEHGAEHRGALGHVLHGDAASQLHRAFGGDEFHNGYQDFVQSLNRAMHLNRLQRKRRRDPEHPKEQKAHRADKNHREENSQRIGFYHKFSPTRRAPRDL